MDYPRTVNTSTKVQHPYQSEDGWKCKRKLLWDYTPTLVRMAIIRKRAKANAGEPLLDVAGSVN